MDRNSFQKLVTARLYPELRELGFKGSGSTLRRLRAPVVDVFNIQGSLGGERFYVNLATTLSFLHDWEQDDPRLKHIKEYECAFNCRLDPADAPGRGWAYGASESEAELIIAQLIECWRTEGMRWFADFETYPDDFARLVVGTDLEVMHPSHLLVHARIARHIGLHENANAIGSAALARCPESATGLRLDIIHFLKLQAGD